MKAKELMIGDWVQDLSPVIIDAISNEDICTYQCKDGYITVNPSNLKPLPLTPEILEKNGFNFGYTASEADFCSAVGCGYPEEKGWCFDEGAGEIKIIFPNDTDGGLIRLDDQCADRHLEFIFGKAIYVHELQHALRLCGIKKEIKL